MRNKLKKSPSALLFSVIITVIIVLYGIFVKHSFRGSENRGNYTLLSPLILLTLEGWIIFAVFFKNYRVDEKII